MFRLRLFQLIGIYQIINAWHNKQCHKGRIKQTANCNNRHWCQHICPRSNAQGHCRQTKNGGQGCHNDWTNSNLSAHQQGLFLHHAFFFKLIDTIHKYDTIVYNNAG